VVGLKNNSKLIGGILIVIGAFMLLPKVAGLVTLLVAIGVIVWGVSMFKREKRV